MKSNFLYVIPLILLASCTKITSGTVIGSILSKEKTVTAKMYESAKKICKNNGGIKNFEIRKTSSDSAYFFCRKQGFLEVTSDGNIQTVHEKDQDVSEVTSTLIDQCDRVCGDGGLESLKAHDCSCKDGKTVIE